MEDLIKGIVAKASELAPEARLELAKGLESAAAQIRKAAGEMAEEEEKAKAPPAGGGAPAAEEPPPEEEKREKAEKAAFGGWPSDLAASY